MRVVFFTNFIPPYRLPALEALANLCDLRLVLSTAMEANRDWQANWGSLRVEVQRGWTRRVVRQNPNGFAETHFIHVPLGTLSTLRRLRPDVVLTGEMGPRTLSVLLGCSRIRPAPPVVGWATLSEDTEAGVGHLRTSIRRVILARLNALVLNGASGRRYIDGILGRRGPAAIHIVPQVALPRPTGVASSRESNHRADARHRVLYVGQLTERKGVAELVSYLEDRGNEAPICLRVVGAGPLKSDFDRLAQLLPEVLEVYPAVPPREVWAHYDWADLFILPTLADEWALVVNEALSAGLPVIGSIRSQAVQELVTEGLNGWVCDPTQSGQVAGALGRAVAVDWQSLQVMRQHALDSVASLTPEYWAESLMNVLKIARLEHG